MRVQISEGGCLEYYYHLDFASQVGQNDQEFIHDSGITIISDRQNYEQVKNLTIDYLEDMMGGAFQFKNPDLVHHCTCGLSFSLES